METYSLIKNYKLLESINGANELRRLRGDILSLRGYGGVEFNEAHQPNVDSYDFNGGKFAKGKADISGHLNVNYYLKDVLFVPLRMPALIDVSISVSEATSSLDELVKKYGFVKV